MLDVQATTWAWCSGVGQSHTLLTEVPLELINNVSVADEGQCVVVDADINTKLDVSPVLVCDGGQVGTLAPDVQMPPARRKLLESGVCT